MTRIAIADYGRKPVEVDLWGHLFEYVAITKQTETKINDAIAEINKSFDGEDLTLHDTQVRLFAARMDVRLKKSPGGRKKASTLVRAAWEDEKLTVPQFDQFWDAVEEAVGLGESPAPIKIEAFASATVEVDLWGTTFETIPVTSKTEPEIRARLTEIDREFSGKEMTHQVQAEIFGARFDARLKSLEEGGQSPAALVQQRWDEGDLDVPQLDRFWQAVLEAIDRPS
jgi:hypothetical protein